MTYTHQLPEATTKRAATIPITAEILADTHDQCPRCGTWNPTLSPLPCPCVPKQ